MEKNPGEQAIRSTVGWALKALAAAGLPGASLAEDAVDAVAKRLDQKRAWEQVKAALARAEEAFRREAASRGWADLADALAQLPVHNLPAFETALRAALGQADPAALQAALRDELAGLPGVDDPALAAQAARLYAARVLDELWKVAALREAVRDVLFKGQVDALRRLEEDLARMRAGLPRQVAVEVWEEKARRDARAAWKALTPPTLPPTTPGAPFSFHELKAPYRFVPFTGPNRLALRDELVAWAEDVAQRPHRSGLRWLWGPGGAGKTRLMVEVGRALEERGWQVGFLPRTPWEKAHLPHWARPDRPTLLVADYAELRNPDQVTTLLDAVVQAAEERPYPLALVLLTRQGPGPGDAATSAGLLAETLRKWRTTGSEALRETLTDEALNQARDLPPLTDAERAELFRAAVERFRERLAVASGTPTVDYPADALPRHPLPLILLALLAAYGHRVAQSRDERAVYEAAWAWERGKWDDALRGAGLWPAEHDLRRAALERVEQALVAATLGRVFRDARDVLAFWEQMPHGEGLLGPRDLRRLAHQLPRLFPPAEAGAGLVPPIAPDPLADEVLARRADLPALTRAVLTGPEGALPPVFPPFLVNTLDRLANLLAGQGDGAGGERIAQAAAAVEARLQTLGNVPPETLKPWVLAWHGALPAPDRTVLWRRVWVVLTRLRVLLAGDKAERAEALNNLGASLSALGRHKEALAVTREAVDIRRQLDQRHPDRFRPDLAEALNNLGAFLSALGRHEDALTATQEAVKHYRALVQRHPDRFRPDLAGALNNLGTFLSALGRPEEALAATQEAVEHYRALAQRHPDRFRPDLAMALNNLGAFLSALGRPEEALAATREAVDIRRQLAQRHPDRFRPDLAMALNNLGNILSALDRHEDALAATKEGVAHYRALAQRHPDRFRPDLAMALNNLGNILSALGRHEDALGATREAVDIYRQLAQRHPDRFLPDLATSLNNLGSDLSALGRHEDALTATQEAVEHYRALAQRHPDRFLPDLAMALNNLGSDLSALDRHEDALAATKEAVEPYRALAQRHPDRFLPDLAMALNNLGSDLSALDRHEDALAATKEAVEHYRALAQRHPDRFLPDLASALTNLGNRLSALGRHEDALVATQEAVEHYRALAQRHPDRFRPELARSLGARGAALLQAGRPAEAAAAFAEGLRALLPFARRLPRAFGSLLANLLNDHLRASRTAGAPPDADVVHEALRVGAQGPAPLPGEIFAWVEEAARSDAPLESEVARILQTIQADENAPQPLRTVAARLLAVLQGERDPEKLTQGLSWDEARNFIALLGELQREGMGRWAVSVGEALRDAMSNVPQAMEYLANLRHQALRSEDETTRAFGRALAAFLEGERDPERLLQGWGEDEPLLATLFRHILA